MERLALHQRVRVHSAAHGACFLGGVEGTVVRMRRADTGAWVALDSRLDGAISAAHPFPADDEHGRGTLVLAYPFDCSPIG